LGEGAVTVAATAIDAAGNPATVSTGGNFTLDTVAPGVAVANTLAGNLVNKVESTAEAGATTLTAEAGSSVTVTFTGSSGSANAVTKTLTATGSAQALTLTAAEVTKLGEGAVTVAATATDAAGNPATVSTGGNFTLDTEAP